MLLLYILISILVFGVLIFVHELGHFIAARSVGVQVNEFALGMGPAIIQKTKGTTTYSLRCIPVGGFCAMEGEDQDTGSAGAFSTAAPWKRLLILVAGSFMNFLAGFLVLVILYSTAAGFATPVISGFFEGSTISQKTGLQVGDELYKIDGKRVYIYSDVSMLLARNTTGVFDLEVKRGDEIVKLNQVPMTPQEFELDGQKVMLYGLNFSQEKNSFVNTIKNSWYTAVDFTRMVWMGLSDLVSGLVSVKEMSGPVGIVSVMAQTGENSDSVSSAVENISFFAAFLAVNLAVMNMLPIPALDGGRVLLLLVTWFVERIIKKKIDPKYEGYIHAATMVLLLGFIAVITMKDIVNLFR